MADPTQAVATFIERLLRGTQNGAVDWKKVQSDPMEYTVVTDTGSIDIKASLGPDGHPLRFQIWKSQDLVDEVTTDPTRSGPFLAWELQLAQIWVMARDKARGVTDTLGALASELHLPPASDDIPF